MDKNQINEHIERLQTQLKSEIQATNFEKASELKLQINRYRALLGHYRTNYNLDENADEVLTSEQVQAKIQYLQVQMQGLNNNNDFDAVHQINQDLKKYEEIIRLIELDKNV